MTRVGWFSIPIPFIEPKICGALTLRGCNKQAQPSPYFKFISKQGGGGSSVLDKALCG